ncbi:MAG: c-type cytochrome biogenesis protein CcmI [Devosiaceae bacterium]|nr:c-type cytochrome biogenesis protein CcmI [Devosiaceae bacterium MH13]
MIWIVFAALTAIAAITVLVPFARARREKPSESDAAADSGGSDAEVYKDQLSEVDRDAARGVLSEAEADAARIEISRRLLKAADKAQADAAAGGSRSARWPGRVVLVTAFALVPLGALGLYGWLGQPGFPDQPLSARLEASVENQDAAILIARVEQAVAQNPDDVRGWSILAPIYARQSRFADARNAYAQLLRLVGNEPQLLTDLGEVIVIENQGLVTQEAMNRFLAALDVEPSFPKARYYRALGLVQDGEAAEARAILEALQADGGPDAPWGPSVAGLLAELDAGGEALQAPQGPQTEAGAAIANLPEAERRQAIQGMVESLAARLADQPDDLAGWSQLIRSYMVLEQPQQARIALERALAFFETDNPARLRLLTIAEEQGILIGQ